MPHQCTNCDRTFADGSKEMLSGCPDCGGNKFQFKPEGVDSVDKTAEPPEPPEPSGASSSVAQTVGKTAATVKDLMGSSSDDHPSPSTGPAGVDQAEPETDAAAPSHEDTAQASARTDVVAPDELPSEPVGGDDDEHHFEPVSRPDTETEDPTSGAAATGESDATEVSAETQPRGDRPDLEELRDELNDQFESIKVLEPGQYELNLMELYDREEYIVALQEDGRYSIQVPENFRE